MNIEEYILLSSIISVAVMGGWILNNLTRKKIN